MINFNFFRRNKFFRRSRQAVENKEQKLNVGDTNASFGSGSGRHDELSDAELGEIKAGYPGSADVREEMEQRQRDIIGSSELNDDELDKVTGGMRR